MSWPGEREARRQRGVQMDKARQAWRSGNIPLMWAHIRTARAYNRNAWKGPITCLTISSRKS